MPSGTGLTSSIGLARVSVSSFNRGLSLVFVCRTLRRQRPHQSRSFLSVPSGKAPPLFLFSLFVFWRPESFSFLLTELRSVGATPSWERTRPGSSPGACTLGRGPSVARSQAVSGGTSWPPMWPCLVKKKNNRWRKQVEGTCPTGAHGLGAFRPFLTGWALRLMSNGDGDGFFGAHN